MSKHLSSLHEDVSLARKQHGRREIPSADYITSMVRAILKAMSNDQLALLPAQDQWSSSAVGLRTLEVLLAWSAKSSGRSAVEKQLLPICQRAYAIFGNNRKELNDLCQNLITTCLTRESSGENQSLECREWLCAVLKNAEDLLGDKRAILCLQALLKRMNSRDVQTSFPGLFPAILEHIHDYNTGVACRKLALEFARKLDSVEALVLPLVSVVSHAQPAEVSTLSDLLAELFREHPILYQNLLDELSGDSAVAQRSRLALIRPSLSAKLITYASLDYHLLGTYLTQRDETVRSILMGVLAILPFAPGPTLSAQLEFAKSFWRCNIGSTNNSFVQQDGPRMLRLMLHRLRIASVVPSNRTGAEANPMLEAYMALADVRVYLEWLRKFLVQGLSPMRPHRIKANAIRLLAVLFESGLDASFALAGKKGGTVTTASWPLELTLADAHMTQTLLKSLYATHVDVKMGAFALLSRFPAPLPGYEDSRAGQDLLDAALESIKAPSEAAVATGSLILRLIRDQWVLKQRCSTLQLHTSSDFAKPESTELPLERLLRQALAVAQNNLTPATCATISALTEHLSPDDLPLTSWRRLNLEVGSLMERFWDDRSKFLANQTAIDDAASADFTDPGNIEVSNAAKVMTLLTALLATLRNVFARATPTVRSSIWTVTEIDAIGRQHGIWLRAVEHSGVYTRIADAYCDLCTWLDSSDWAEGSDLIDVWLAEHLEDMSHSKLNNTRRSGGTALCCLAVLSAIRSARRDRLVSITVARLRVFADTRHTADDVGPQVHALNTLRLLVQDEQLRDTMMNHIEPSFLIAINTFRSKEWSIRNGALMLFAALVERCFRGKSRTKQMSAHSFCIQYPTVLDSIESELDEVQPGRTSDEARFACLSLIGSFAVSQDSSDKHIDARIEQLRRKTESLLGNPHWMMRQAAAKATAALVTAAEVLSVCRSMLIVSSSNATHGRLWTVANIASRLNATQAEDLLHALCTFLPQLRAGSAVVLAAALTLAHQLYQITGLTHTSRLATQLTLQAKDAFRCESSIGRKALHTSIAGLQLLASPTAGRDCLQSKEPIVRSAVLRSEANLDDCELRLLQLALDQAGDHRERAMCFSRLKGLSTPLDEQQAQLILKEALQTTDGHLKQAILPFLACQQSLDVCPAVTALVESLSLDERSWHARLAAAQSLGSRMLSPIIPIMLFVDDDREVRDTAASILGEERVEAIAIPSRISSLGACDAAELLCELDGQNTAKVRQRVKGSIFSAERSNMFIDDLLCISATYNVAPMQADAGDTGPFEANVKAILDSLASMLGAAGGSSSPLHVLADPGIVLQTYRLIALVRLLGNRADLKARLSCDKLSSLLDCYELDEI
ncbi:uncharacterized protein L969DRAFT_94072 [Mixia osmundae IAM 14324]|uniref:Uncharacterized protein n=1 Tax=Mixia osmundae (strain CBS 9802 / IAM 14324 / JCM 22182 / KY 12970) TaxID=764103 RepID=G7E903_MIXOS|nr:uncharacterized protein L969DRAFT_94072 [Mixia osmundae IAM 14324]KEI40257.1 hypothetical protein L969DRAFT_94072 [Mixia osmundae IAM 14324]GAA99621.1 hypothetical protein E5Q_06322 [Mixia osmundae IAM 14324]